MKRKTPLRSGKGLRPGKGLRRVSRRRQGERQRRLDVVGFVTERDRTCVGLRLLPGHTCSGPLDVHEKKTRARGGSALDADNAVLLCRTAHDFVHANPTAAQAAGLLLSSWEEA